MASSITVKLTGVEGLQKHFSRLQSSEKVLQAVRQATAVVESTAKHYAPTGETGTLRSSIHMTTSQVGREITGRVFAGGGHAMYVEFGTGVVGQASGYPRAAALGLKYAQYPWVYTPDGGEHFYRTRGYRARPFMYPALHTNKTKIKTLIANAVREDVRK